MKKRLGHAVQVAVAGGIHPDNPLTLSTFLLVFRSPTRPIAPPEKVTQRLEGRPANAGRRRQVMEGLGAWGSDPTLKGAEKPAETAQ